MLAMAQLQATGEEMLHPCSRAVLRIWQSSHLRPFSHLPTPALKYRTVHDVKLKVCSLQH